MIAADGSDAAVPHIVAYSDKLQLVVIAAAGRLRAVLGCRRDCVAHVFFDSLLRRGVRRHL